MDAVAVGKRIRERMGQLGMNQVEFAKEVEKHLGQFSNSHLSRILAGKAGDLKYETIRAISRAAGVSPGWLVDGDSPDFMRAVLRLGANEDIASALVRISGWYETAAQHDQAMLAANLKSIADEINRPGFQMKRVTRVNGRAHADADAGEEVRADEPPVHTMS